MRIGIFTRYCRLDFSYALLHLADLLEQLGHTVSLFSELPNMISVRPDWDRRVQQACRHRYTRWIQDCDVIIWCRDARDQVEWASERGIRNILVYFPDLWDAPDAERLQPFDRVVAPTQAMAAALRPMRLGKNLTQIPWSTGLPATRKGARNTPLKVLLPISGSQYFMGSGAGLGLILDVLRLNLPAQLTLERSAWAGRQTTLLRHVQQVTRGDPRLQIVRNQTYDQKLLLMGEHDLVLLTCEIESMGLYALYSLTMGTPVVAYDMAPLNELVQHGINGLLVPPRFYQSPSTGLTVARNIEAFCETLVDTLCDPTLVEQLQQGTSLQLAERAESFRSGWDGLLRTLG